MNLIARRSCKGIALDYFDLSGWVISRNIHIVILAALRFFSVLEVYTDECIDDMHADKKHASSRSSSTVDVENLSQMEGICKEVWIVSSHMLLYPVS